MRVRSLAGRLLVLQLTVVAVTVAAGALITVLVARERTETRGARPQPHRGAHRRGAPRDPAGARRTLTRARPSSRWPRALRTEARVSFITIMRPDGIRYTHPTPSLIGKRFVGTFEPAARGQTVTETTTGTLGRSVRAVVPVARERRDRRAGRRRRAHRGDRRRGRRAAARPDRLRGADPGRRRRGSACCSPAASSARRSASSRRRSRRCTPTTTRPCTRSARASWCSTSTAGPRWSTTRREAPARRRPTLDPATLGDDTPLIAGDRVLLASARAVVRDGRRVGSVVTLRDRTEVETLARELGATKALADALRAQTHEAANRLHVIAGLVELGRTEEAIELAGSEAASAQDLLGRLGEGIEEPVLVALLLGKTANARERGVDAARRAAARACAPGSRRPSWRRSSAT